ncbi:hypothetical protein AB1Y20_001881 [Prymnesium parvum]|uniref:Saposin B-type domain-containing protein n=1 Tax=Prymnesium parvum TaxID=97485 RepID=A0AB34J7G6_PRYPA
MRWVVLLLILATPAAVDARRKRQKAKEPPLPREERIARQQDCEMCGLVMGSLQEGLQQRQAKLRLSKEAAERRQAYVDGVQKAQTKRWLKQEYGVELVDALEDALDGICERKAEVVERICGVPSFSTINPKEVEIAKKSVLKQPLKGGEGYDGFKPEECRGRIKTQCLRVVEAKAEEMQRAALDGGGPEACLELWPSCSRMRAFLYHNSTAEAAAAQAKHERSREEFERRAKQKANPTREAAGMFGDVAEDFMNMMKDEI